MKARAIRLIAFVALGTVVNLVVSWRFALVSSNGPTDSRMTAREAAGLWRRYAPAGWHNEGPIDGRRIVRPGVTESVLLPESSKATDNDMRPGPTRYCTVTETGWPFRAMVGAELVELRGPVVKITRVASWTPRRFLVPRHPYPLRPLWPATLANTAFYAAMLGLAVGGAGHLRRRARLDRRQCPRCRYDLRTAIGVEIVTCPECGTQLAGGRLAGPRMILRGWMAPLVAPALLLGIMFFAGLINVPWAQFHVRWAYPFPPRGTMITFLIAATWLYFVCLAAYGDRSPRVRHLLAGGISSALAAVAVTSTYVFAVWLLSWGP